MPWRYGRDAFNGSTEERGEWCKVGVEGVMIVLIKLLSRLLSTHATVFVICEPDILVTLPRETDNRSELDCILLPGIMTSVE
jgi:hypothetical protein